MEVKNIAEFISKPQFIDSILIEELKRYLSERCSDYAKAEKEYLKRLQEFEGTGETSKTIIREAIELREKSIAASHELGIMLMHDDGTIVMPRWRR